MANSNLVNPNVRTIAEAVKPRKVTKKPETKKPETKKRPKSRPVVERVLQPELAAYHKLRTQFDAQVALFMGKAFLGSMSIDLEAASWLVDRCRQMGPATILEFGSGFSTVALASYLETAPSCSMISLDHNKAWMKFVAGQIKPSVSQRINWLTIDDFIVSGRFDLIRAPSIAFVDSGPTYLGRCEHVMFAAGLLRRNGGGLLVLDDYHTNAKRRRMYTDMIVPRLREVGLNLELVPTTGPPNCRRYIAWTMIG